MFHSQREEQKMDPGRKRPTSRCNKYVVTIETTPGLWRLSVATSTGTNPSGAKVKYRFSITVADRD